MFVAISGLATNACSEDPASPGETAAEDLTAVRLHGTWTSTADTFTSDDPVRLVIEPSGAYAMWSTVLGGADGRETLRRDEVLTADGAPNDADTARETGTWKLDGSTLTLAGPVGPRTFRASRRGATVTLAGRGIDEGATFRFR